MCETVSLVALNRLAATWKTSPPHSGWESYAPAFSEYAARLIGGEHRRAMPHESLAGWYGANRAALEVNPYLRAMNEKVATVLLELLESSPEALGAIGYLNAEAAQNQGFAAYLAAWYDCCPEQHRPFVRRLMDLFSAS